MEERLRMINERMRRIDRMRMKIAERMANELGILPSHHYLLMILGREGRMASQAEIAEKLHVSPARVTLVMKQLDVDGYIKRESGKDGRRNEITITDKGKAVLVKSRAFFKKLNEETYSDFTQEELDQFYDYLERAIARLTHIEEAVKREDGE